LSDAVTPGLLDEAVREIMPENAPRDFAVIVALEVVPPAIVRFDGVEISWKEACCTNTAKDASCAKLPETPWTEKR